MTLAAPAWRAATAEREPLLPAAPMITATDPFFHHALRQRGRTAHIQHCERQRHGEVVGEDGGY